MEKTAKIQASFNFEMSHKLTTSYSKECEENIHGHSYQADVCIKSTINSATGVIIDFKLLKEKLGQELFESFDHALILNKEEDKLIKAVKPYVNKLIVTNFNTTAENLVHFLASKIYFIMKMDTELLRDLSFEVSVKLWEGRKNWAEVNFTRVDYLDGQCADMEVCFDIGELNKNEN